MPTPSVDPHRLEELRNYCVDFAKQMLNKSGEFYPFAARIGSDGQLSAVGLHTGDEHPKGQEVFLGLQNTFKDQFAKKEILAAAIAANVDIPKQYSSPYPDGIRVLLECEGYSRFFYLPYRLSKPSALAGLFGRRGRLELGEFISVDVPPTLMR